MTVLEDSPKYGINPFSPGGSQVTHSNYSTKDTALSANNTSVNWEPQSPGASADH